MKKVWKYGVVPVVIFLFLLVVTVMLMPVLIDVQKYVPEIEKSISKASGRPFSIGSDVTVSFFPWLSLSFSDLKLGNPPGFVSDSLVKIDSFEARVKLLPLLKKEIQISRFVVGGLEVSLERNGEGKVNWESLRLLTMPQLDFLQDNILCTLLAVTDGKVNWIDRKNHVRHSVADLMLLLNNAQPDRAIALDFKAAYDGKPIALEGKIGPLRQQQGKESLPVDVGFHFFEMLQGEVRGKVENWQLSPVYDIAIKLSPFSPRELFAALGLAFPVEAADSTTFQAVELDLAVAGKGDSLTIEKGTARLDDTRVVLSGEAKGIKQPKIGFSLNIDRLDLDRYLPSPHPDKPAHNEENGQISAQSAALKTATGMMYSLARTATLAGTMNIEALKVYGGTVSNLLADLGGKDGIITLDHTTMNFYGGQVQANLVADLSGEMPEMRIGVQSQGVDSEAMLREVNGRELLAGTLSGDLALDFSGDTTDAMQKSLRGEGTFLLHDGALLGVDLYRSIERRELVAAGPGNDRAGVRTDFSELKGGVTVEGGLLNLREMTLQSPAMAMVIGGRADIIDGKWELQVAPQGLEPKPGKGKSPLPLSLAGTFVGPDFQIGNRRQSTTKTTDGTKGNVAILVDEKIPSPVDDDVKDLVGKPLIDPAIVAQRFHLQRETIRRTESKKQLQLGSGKIRINPLLEERSL